MKLVISLFHGLADDEHPDPKASSETAALRRRLEAAEGLAEMLLSAEAAMVVIEVGHQKPLGWGNTLTDIRTALAAWKEAK